MKECRFCFTSIHNRATVCPECHHCQTLFGSLRSTILTGFPILAAVVSIGFAIFEKTQANYARQDLASTTAQLQVEELRSEVAEDAVIELSQRLPQVSSIVHPGGNQHVEADPQSIVNDIDRRLSEHLKTPKLTPDQVKALHAERLKLRIQQPQANISRFRSFEHR